MGQVFRSGAFLQQCWSVHPLCLGVRRITAENQLALACTSCRFAHYVSLGCVAQGTATGSDEPERPGDALDTQSDARARLASCLTAHAAALSLREMDVFKDLVILRCAECRRHYQVAVTAFETHQK
jgi:ribosomal protein L33